MGGEDEADAPSAKRGRRGGAKRGGGARSGGGAVVGLAVEGELPEMQLEEEGWDEDDDDAVPGGEEANQDAHGAGPVSEGGGSGGGGGGGAPDAAPAPLASDYDALKPLKKRWGAPIVAPVPAPPAAPLAVQQAAPDATVGQDAAPSAGGGITDAGSGGGFADPMAGMFGTLDEDVEEFDDGFGEDLMGDEEDRAYLAELPLVEREQVLYERDQRRQLGRMNVQMRRQLLEAQRQKVGWVRSGAPPSVKKRAAPKATPAKRAPVPAIEPRRHTPAAATATAAAAAGAGVAPAPSGPRPPSPSRAIASSDEDIDFGGRGRLAMKKRAARQRAAGKKGRVAKRPPSQSPSGSSSGSGSSSDSDSDSSASASSSSSSRRSARGGSSDDGGSIGDSESSGSSARRRRARSGAGERSATKEAAEGRRAKARAGAGGARRNRETHDEDGYSSDDDRRSPRASGGEPAMTDADEWADGPLIARSALLVEGARLANAPDAPVLIGSAATAAEKRLRQAGFAADVRDELMGTAPIPPAPVPGSGDDLMRRVEAMPNDAVLTLPALLRYCFERRKMVLAALDRPNFDDLVTGAYVRIQQVPAGGVSRGPLTYRLGKVVGVQSADKPYDPWRSSTTGDEAALRQRLQPRIPTTRVLLHVAFGSSTTVGSFTGGGKPKGDGKGEGDKPEKAGPPRLIPLHQLSSSFPTQAEFDALCERLRSQHAVSHSADDLLPSVGECRKTQRVRQEAYLQQAYTPTAVDKSLQMQSELFTADRLTQMANLAHLREQKHARLESVRELLKDLEAAVAIASSSHADHVTAMERAAADKLPTIRALQAEEKRIIAHLGMIAAEEAARAKRYRHAEEEKLTTGRDISTVTRVLNSRIAEHNRRVQAIMSEGMRSKSSADADAEMEANPFARRRTAPIVMWKVGSGSAAPPVPAAPAASAAPPAAGGGGGGGAPGDDAAMQVEVAPASLELLLPGASGGSAAGVGMEMDVEVEEAAGPPAGGEPVGDVPPATAVAGAGAGKPVLSLSAWRKKAGLA